MAASSMLIDPVRGGPNFLQWCTWNSKYYPGKSCLKHVAMGLLNTFNVPEFENFFAAVCFISMRRPETTMAEFIKELKNTSRPVCIFAAQEMKRYMSSVGSSSFSSPSVPLPEFRDLASFTYPDFHTWKERGELKTLAKNIREYINNTSPLSDTFPSLEILSISHISDFATGDLLLGSHRDANFTKKPRVHP